MFRSPHFTKRLDECSGLHSTSLWQKEIKAKHKNDHVSNCAVVCWTKAGRHLAKFWLLGSQKFDGTEQNLQVTCIGWVESHLVDWEWNHAKSSRLHAGRGNSLFEVCVPKTIVEAVDGGCLILLIEHEITRNHGVSSLEEAIDLLHDMFRIPSLKQWLNRTVDRTDTSIIVTRAACQNVKKVSRIRTNANCERVRRRIWSASIALRSWIRQFCEYQNYPCSLFWDWYVTCYARAGWKRLDQTRNYIMELSDIVDWFLKAIHWSSVPAHCSFLSSHSTFIPNFSQIPLR